jgi:hypothetical protein
MVYGTQARSATLLKYIIKTASRKKLLEHFLLFLVVSFEACIGRALLTSASRPQLNRIDWLDSQVEIWLSQLGPWQIATGM